MILLPAPVYSAGAMPTIMPAQIEAQKQLKQPPAPMALPKGAAPQMLPPRSSLPPIEPAADAAPLTPAGVMPADAVSEVSPPQQPKPAHVYNRKNFIPLSKARMAGNIRPSSKYLVKDDQTIRQERVKPKKELPEIEPAQKAAPLTPKGTGDSAKPAEGVKTPATSQAILSIFPEGGEAGNVDETLSQADDTALIAIPSDAQKPDAVKPRAFIRTRHGWPLDQRIGQVIKKQPESVRIHAPSGSQVMASATGQVVSVEDAGAAGWTITLRHKDDSISRYAHLARAAVDRGETVKRRQMLGSLGRTGDGQDPFLEYQLKKHDKAVPPLDVLYLPSRIKKAINATLQQE